MDGDIDLSYLNITGFLLPVELHLLLDLNEFGLRPQVGWVFTVMMKSQEDPVCFFVAVNPAEISWRLFMFKSVFRCGWCNYNAD